ncbi:hypothetical protein L2D00_04345 [Hyphomonadaceae bacterium BL14]|nr:hypothetical protein L2D00_04345 [Hyphomonadaceae bacterium BL14]
MMRMILISALAFIIPFIVWYAAARVRKHDGHAPIGLLSLAGAACVMVTVTALALVASDDGDGAQDYAPPRIERERTPPGHLGPRGDSPGQHRTPNDPGPSDPDLEPVREPAPGPAPEPAPAPDR